MLSLLTLWLLHLFALNCPVSGHPLLSREAPVPCDPDIDTRTLFGIVSGCLATVFACTWVSVHPNVPRPSQGKLSLAWNRFSLMLVAVIAPELMAGFAARQFLDARWFSKKYDVSITHGFFFAMGGFVSAGHHPIVTEEQLRLHPEYLAAIRSTRVKAIEDKSKGDLLSKGVVLLQGLWFTAQCLTRLLQHLTLTELEVATLAFQFVNLAIWFLWLHKPLDVQQPIILGPADELVALAKPSHRLSQNHSPLEAAGDNVCILLGGHWSDLDFTTSTSVPSYWSTHGFCVKGPGKGDTRFVSSFIFIELLAGTLFGLVHCAAWNAHFPSTAELLIWRFCSLAIAATPSIITFMYGFGLLNWKMGWNLDVMFMRSVSANFNCILGCIIWAAVVAYIFARLLLIVLSFTTLRALPPGAFADVNWTAYIPHL
ncbi:hypothetical protein DFH08DRAFT_763491 [Mycena albidolilacea]|uniref:Uncharacterized protein n=1 Tax=Mycena albidolilacea TaxID=1033008 RepID=A0AAD7F4U1_9AGAR|nr:hypothetical protein DFH08DRAFT_763491 [Mycena albidolilacea]